MKRTACLLCALLIFLSGLPAGAAESEGLPDSMSFQEVLGLASPDQVERAVLVYQNERVAELTQEEIAWLMEAHWSFSMMRVTSPAMNFSENNFTGSYINLYTSEGKRTLETYFSRICVGTYGDIYAYYAPGYQGGKNELYRRTNTLYEKYKEQAAVPAQPETPCFPETSWLRLPQDEWAVADIYKAAAVNLMPYEWTNRYREPITREEFCILVARAMGQLGAGGRIAHNHSWASADLTQLRKRLLGEEETTHFAEFTDVTYEFKPSGDLEPLLIVEQITNLLALSVVAGRDDGSFDPGGTLTRQEAAKILANAAKWFVGIKTNGVSFEDDDKIAPWAREQVSFLAENGVMGGVGDNHFDPWGTLSVQQAVAAVVRLYALCEANDPANP